MEVTSRRKTRCKAKVSVSRRRPYPAVKPAFGVTTRASFREGPIMETRVNVCKSSFLSRGEMSKSAALTRPASPR